MCLMVQLTHAPFMQAIWTFTLLRWITVDKLESETLLMFVPKGNLGTI